MTKGIETLSELEMYISQIRDSVATLDNKQEMIFKISQRNKLRQRELINEIAKVHFDSMKKGEDALEYESDKNIEHLLKRRASSFEDLKRLIDELKNSLSRYEKERYELKKVLEKKLQNLSALQSSVQEKLKNDNIYKQALQEVKKAKELADTSRKKALEASSKYKQKMKPFEDDLLFLYLYKRGYASSKYNSSGLTRVMDDWVAKVCNFRENIDTYTMLLKIPKRVEENADYREKEYKKGLQKLVALEESPSKKEGLEELKSECEEDEKKVQQLDAKISDAEKELEGAFDDRKRFMADEDRYAKEITEVMSKVLLSYGANSIYELSRAKTTTREDDKLSRELLDVQQESRELQAQIGKTQREYEQKIEALKEAEALRSRFKRSRFDDFDSRFDSNLHMGTIVADILGGIISNAGAWDRVSRHQIPTSNNWSIDFGSGGFSDTDSPWFSPSSIDITGGFDSSSFTTGGGF